MSADDERHALFLHSLTDLGGGETSLLELATALTGSRYRPVVICPREGPLTHALREREIPVEILPYQLPSRRARLTPWWALTPTLRLARALRRYRAAVVCASDPTSALFGFPAARLARRPAVWLCHGWWVRPTAINRWFLRTLPRRIVAVSSEVSHELAVHLGQQAIWKTRVIPLGIDTTRFAPSLESVAARRALQLPPTAAVVTTIGRFQEVKGQADLLTAAEQVVRLVPDVLFLFVGDVAFGNPLDEAYKRSLIARVEGNPMLRTHTKFLGFRSDIPAIMAASDIIVVPSRFESFGKVAVEAMASGRAVVCTAVGGMVETVVNEVTGLLVPPTSSDELAKGIARLLKDEPLRRTMGEAGRQRVTSSFSLDAQARAFIALFDELTGQARGLPTEGRRFAE